MRGAKTQIFYHPDIDMSTTSNSSSYKPYLFFNGSCEQAVEFYPQGPRR
jgi:hypothetical protein